MGRLERLHSDNRQVVLREFVNMDVLKGLIKRNSGVPSDIKKKLKDYDILYHATYGEGKQTSYAFKNKKPIGQKKRFGRMKKDYRSALAADVLQDIDMVGAAPSIFKGILSYYNLSSKALEFYLNDRSAALAKWKLVTKEDFLKILFNEHASNKKLHPDLVEMHHTMYDIAYPQIASDYQGIVKFCKEKCESVPNKGSVMANVFQAVESIVLMEAIEFFHEHDVVPSVLCFDGVMVIKNEKVNDRLLDLLHEHTVETTGFDIKWAEKEITTTGKLVELDFPNHCDNAKAFVAKILEKEPAYDQEYAFKILRHIDRLKEEEDKDSFKEVLKCYIGEYCRKDLFVSKFYFRTSTDDAWQMNVPQSTVEMAMHYPMFHRFMPQVKTRIFDFYKPTWGEQSGKIFIEHFNAFPGFAASNLGFKVDECEVAPYFEYIRQVICSGREAEYMFVLKWIQELFKSSKANGVVLCITGLEGTGKGFFYKTLAEHLLGKDLCLTLNNADQFLAQTFNSELENKSLVLFDEMPALGHKQRKTMFDKLKNMTTDDKILINEKSVRRYVAKNMNNFMINSNNEAILPLTESGRRVFCLKVSNIHRCDEDYFEALEQFVEKNANKIFTYLMNLDLSHIRLSKFPRNEDRDAMVAASIDPVASLIKEFTDKFEMSKAKAFDLKKAFKKFQIKDTEEDDE
ncbi:hypothetical protein GGF32_001834 [Allomyces javanicus]|nr:hypothetical protein GGF32_001834 [Allomyces javanicus]